jgi:hypothetical protein
MLRYGRYQLRIIGVLQVRKIIENSRVESKGEWANGRGRRQEASSTTIVRLQKENESHHNLLVAG